MDFKKAGLIQDSAWRSVRNALKDKGILLPDLQSRRLRHIDEVLSAYVLGGFDWPQFLIRLHMSFKQEVDETLKLIDTLFEVAIDVEE